MNIKLEDQGQDFLTLEVNEQGQIAGYSPMFADGRITLLGIGSLDGMDYFTRDEVLADPERDYSGLYVYIKDSGKKDPLPWEASTLNYKVV